MGTAMVRPSSKSTDSVSSVTGSNSAHRHGTTGSVHEAEYNVNKERTMTALEKLIEELPPDLRQEVEDFARFLLTNKANRYRQKVRTKPTFRWAGAVEDLR